MRFSAFSTRRLNDMRKIRLSPGKHHLAALYLLFFSCSVFLSLASLCCEETFLMPHVWIQKTRWAIIKNCSTGNNLSLSVDTENPSFFLEKKIEMLCLIKYFHFLCNHLRVDRRGWVGYRRRCVCVCVCVMKNNDMGKIISLILLNPFDMLFTLYISSTLLLFYTSLTKHLVRTFYFYYSILFLLSHYVAAFLFLLLEDFCKSCCTYRISQKPFFARCKCTKKRKFNNYYCL